MFKQLFTIFYEDYFIDILLEYFIEILNLQIY